MGKLNISKNLFLEKAELDQFQDFLINNPTSALFSSVTQQYGIISSPNNGGDDFLIEAGSTGGTIKTVLDSETSIAITSNNLLITALPFVDYELTDDNQIYWLKISHKYRNYEVDTVNVNSEGIVTGAGTNFLTLLRDQPSKVPTSVKFISVDSEFNESTPTNSGVYEIIDIVSDTSLILAGNNFTAENNLRYIVVGSYTLGTNLTTEQEDGIYSYDDVDYSLVLAVDENTPPAGLVSGKEFYIAAVRRNGTTVDVWDRRDDYYWTVDFGVTLNNKANTDASNVTPATYAADWWDMLSYLSSRRIRRDVADGNYTVPSTVAILELYSSAFASSSTITLPSASASGNIGKVIKIYINSPSAWVTGDELFHINDGANVLLTRDLDYGWLEFIEVKSNGTNWYITNSYIQGTTGYPGMWEKATSTEVTSATTDKVITSDNIRNLTATTTRPGIQENADASEVLALTSSTRTVTPNGLNNLNASTTQKGIQENATDTETEAGTSSAHTVTPSNLNDVYTLKTFNIDGVTDFSGNAASNVVDDMKYRKIGNNYLITGYVAFTQSSGTTPRFDIDISTLLDSIPVAECRVVGLMKKTTSQEVVLVLNSTTSERIYINAPLSGDFENENYMVTFTIEFRVS